MKKIKEIVVISGKGGTGKTTITASLAELIPNKVLVDADVDAANLYLLLSPENIKKSNFYGKPVASINPGFCTSCGLCQELCRFHAIESHDVMYRVDELACEGCRLCESACPVQAIEMKDRIVGQWMTAETRWGDFVYARLNPGGENSGNLVTKVKRQAKQVAEEKNREIILIDGPPGIGCPVISAISGSDYAIVVTEPSLSGMGDLKRILELTEHFRVPRGLIINKFDINKGNSKKIEEQASRNNVEVLARIPHDYCIIHEITQQRIPLEKCSMFKIEIEKIYNKMGKIFQIP